MTDPNALYQLRPPNRIWLQSSLWPEGNFKALTSDDYIDPSDVAYIIDSPAAIAARYEELKQEGLIVTGQGSATVNIEGRQE